MTNAGKGVEKRNPYTLLVGMYICLSTMEISMEAPQKTENRGPGMVAPIYNPSYLGDRSRRISVQGKTE
jgi:hypothetical protein